MSSASKVRACESEGSITITLASNFGTFLLYMLSCITCIVCFHGHPQFNFVRHLAIPVFGLLANLGCMIFYLIGPLMGYGTKMEPWGAMIIAALWGAYGAFYFMKSSKAKGKSVLLESRAA